ncbi:MAG: murein biosynthesis integral membrane protein MurJ [Alphaproteobacteria bacterium]
MYRALLSTSGFTLLSRITGFIRDMIMASVLAPGLLSDAFFVAFRLPNHFRAIFAEGAYNAAFVPMYSGLRATDPDKAEAFSRTMLGWQVLIQAVLLAVAMIAMPQVVLLLAPGFAGDPAQVALASELTRITFAYLLCITVVTHLGGVLNSRDSFWAAAAAPVLLNICMSVALVLVVFFPTAAHAAAWGVLAGGVAELLLLLFSARRLGASILPGVPRLTEDVRTFFGRFVPATVGAAGVQLAMFADTIFASFLGAGAYTSLYFADRINQLPMGVIAIALGTVLLPQVSKSVKLGDLGATHRAFRRATETGLLLTLPCTAAFFVIPDIIMTGLFARGAFSVEAAHAAAAVLLAYAAGLPAFVMLRTVTPLFHARGDTRTPVVATGIAIGVNLALKALFVMGLNFGVVGLALATAIGTWVNVLVLGGQGWRLGYMEVSAAFAATVARMAGAAAYAGVVAWLLVGVIADMLSPGLALRAEILMVVMGLVGLGAYGLGLLAVGWRR